MRGIELSLLAALAAALLAGCVAWEIPLLGESNETYIERLKPSTPPDLRREAILKLKEQGKSEPPEVRAKILEILKAIITDPKEDVLTKSAAIAAASELGGGVVAPALVDALNDPYAIVRIDAAHALGRMALPSTREPLIRALREDPYSAVRLAAARSLRNFRSGDVIVALIETLDDPERAVAYTAWESLRRITGENLGYQRQAWQDWWQEKEPLWQ